MTENGQTELVPATPAERIAAVRRKLEAAAEKADARAEKAADKAAAAWQEIAEFDDAVAAIAGTAAEVGAGA